MQSSFQISLVHRAQRRIIIKAINHTSKVWHPDLSGPNMSYAMLYIIYDIVYSIIKKHEIKSRK